MSGVRDTALPTTVLNNAEVIVKIENSPLAFGFGLRPDDKLPAAQAMFALLQDAYNANAPIAIEYDERPGIATTTCCVSYERDDPGICDGRRGNRTRAGQLSASTAVTQVPATTGIASSVVWKVLL